MEVKVLRYINEVQMIFEEYVKEIKKNNVELRRWGEKGRWVYTIRTSFIEVTPVWWAVFIRVWKEQTFYGSPHRKRATRREDKEDERRREGGKEEIKVTVGRGRNVYRFVENCAACDLFRHHAIEKREWYWQVIGGVFYSPLAIIGFICLILSH